MALPNVTMAALSGLVEEYAPARFVSTVMMNSAILGSGVLPIEDVTSEEIVIALKGGANPSATLAGDFDDRPAGNTTLPSKARFSPVTVTGTVALGLTASQMDVAASGGLGSLVKREIDSAAEGVSRTLGRAVYSSTIQPAATATWSSTAANGTVSVDFADGSLFKAGASYDYVNGTQSYVVRCTGKVGKAVGGNSARVGATVSFINDIPNGRTGVISPLSVTGVALTDTFALRGTYAGFAGSTTPVATRKINSFEDIAGSGSLGGVSAAQCIGWAGTTQASSGAYSQESAELFAGVVEAEGGNFTHAIMGTQLSKAHKIMAGGFGAFNGIGATALPMASASASSSKYGNNSNLELSGRPVLVDHNCPATMLVLTNAEQCKLGRWRDFKPEDVAGNGQAVFVDQQTLSVKSFVTGLFQMYPENRAAVGIMTGITGL